MDPSDPGEGPSKPRVPPKSLKRLTDQQRRAMVRDIEEITETSYIPQPHPHSRTFSVSTDSNDDGGTEIEDSSVGVNTPPDSPTSNSTFGGSWARSSGQRPRSLNSLSSPWSTMAFERYRERESERGESSSTGPVEGIGPIGQVSVMRPTLQRPNSSHTASSYAMYSPRSPLGPSRMHYPPPVPNPDLKYSALPPINTQRISDSSSKEDWNERSVLKQSAQSGGGGTRPSSTHTASSYALYTPRSATSSKLVRFSGMQPGGAGDAVPPLPPHALEALAREHDRQRSPISPAFFHGPPPLFNSDEVPPPYREKYKLYTNRGRFKVRFAGGIREKDAERASGEWSEKPCYKRRSKKFWIIIGVGIALSIFGLIIGVVAGLKKRRGNGGGVLGTNSTISAAGEGMPAPPPPLSMLGAWTFTTNLTAVKTDCAYNDPTTVWACYPFQNPPSTSPGIFNFIINSTDTGPDRATNSDALTIQTPKNPFALEFGPIPLTLHRTITDEYYTFTYNFTKTTIVNFNSSAAQCTFPHSQFIGHLFFNPGGEGGPEDAVRHSTDTRGEWNGRVELRELKFGGGEEVECRDRATQAVDYTGRKADGTCLCQYTNYDSQGVVDVNDF